LEGLGLSGAETLVPYLKDKKGGDPPLIIVDSNEASVCSKIVRGLKDRAVDVSVQRLEKGDYVLSDVCAIERKTVQDFVYTLTRRHLFEQLFKLKEVYPQSILLLEGYLPIIYKFSRIKPASVWGAMFALAKEGVTMVHTTSYKETIDFLYVAARQEQSLERRVPIVHPVKRTKTLADSQIFFLSSLPNIGHEKAVSLLKSYQTPLNALINVNGWSKDVHGLGPKITKRAKKVLETPHET
jgi:ERCC4-type nuclease